MYCNTMQTSSRKDSAARMMTGNEGHHFLSIFYQLGRNVYSIIGYAIIQLLQIIKPK